MNKAVWIFVALGVVLLAGLFVLFRPEPDAPAGPPPPPPPGVSPAAPLPQAIQLVVKGGRLASGPSVIQVQQGAEVLIDIVADKTDQLHLHGYDLRVDLQAGAPAQLRFVADKTGRFEYELHEAQTELGALEVLPK
jgi:hypothetical protein